MPTAGGDAPHAIGIVSSLVAGVGIWDFDLRRGTLECDAGWYRIMGRDPEQPVRSLAGFRPLIHPEDVDRATEVEQTAGELLASNRDYSIIFRIIRPSGEIRWVRSAASLIQDADGKPVRAVGFVLDITDSWRGELALRHANRRLEEEKTSLARQSLEDPLTGLANRRFLDSELARLCVEANEHREPLSLAMIDVDFFKNYNDRYGHLAGDEALRCIAEAIHSVARRSDIAARDGGEEFVVGFPARPIPSPSSSDWRRPSPRLICGTKVHPSAGSPSVAAARCSRRADRSAARTCCRPAMRRCTRRRAWGATGT